MMMMVRSRTDLYKPFTSVGCGIFAMLGETRHRRRQNFSLVGLFGHRSSLELYMILPINDHINNERNIARVFQLVADVWNIERRYSAEIMRTVKIWGKGYALVRLGPSSPT